MGSNLLRASCLCVRAYTHQAHQHICGALLSHLGLVARSLSLSASAISMKLQTKGTYHVDSVHSCDVGHRVHDVPELDYWQKHNKQVSGCDMVREGRSMRLRRGLTRKQRERIMLRSDVRSIFRKATSQSRYKHCGNSGKPHKWV